MRQKKLATVVFVDEKTQKAFDLLMQGTFAEKELHQSIKKTVLDLFENPAAGIQIRHNLWPKEYTEKYQINNLWKYNLPNGWRLIYTIKDEELLIVSIILEWFPHKEYEKRFGY